MIIGGTAYNELICDNYTPRGGEWVKMSKDEFKVYDKDLDIKKIYADDDKSSSDYTNINEFKYDKDGHVISPF